MNCGEKNEWFAKCLIDLLIGQGVDYFCCAPGSRSTPLAIAVFDHKLAKRFVHFDERALAFHALGFAKASRRPVAIIVTSGTAVANLLPAVIEAHHERVPLLLLTADRPFELQACGANQTCDQLRLFENFTRWQVELPSFDSLSDVASAEAYLSSTVNQAVILATQSPAGPVHLNCPFREPLFAKAPLSIPSTKSVHFSSSLLFPSPYSVAEWAERLQSDSIQKGVILCGSDHLPYAESIFCLAEKLNWPIFADILSPLRQVGSHDLLVTHFDPLLKVKKEIEIDAIIQFGNRFVSKTLQQWLEKQRLSFYLHVCDHMMRQDPSHLITHRLHTSPQLFAQHLCHSLLPKEGNGRLFKEWNEKCHRVFKQELEKQERITEPGIFSLLSLALNQEFALFLSNSMPIRDANQFFAPKEPCGPLFANRGVSGIDGNIATVVGIASGTEKPTVAVIGDLSCLHDLTSLAQVSKSSYPILLLIINNQGGGIFSFLPISERQDFCEEMIAAPHPWEFQKAAELFSLPYFHPKSTNELSSLLEHLLKHPQSGLIEITTDREENVYFHQELTEALNTCLNLPLSHQEIPSSLH